MATEKEWIERYIKLAKEVSTWSSCLRHQVGCIITVGRRVVATGYNGAPSGIPSCKETLKCLRKDSCSGQNLNNCVAVHAEQNAILQASKLGISVKGGIMYITTFPCSTCMKLIINSGISKIYYLEDYPDYFSKELAEASNIEIIRVKL